MNTQTMAPKMQMPMPAKAQAARTAAASNTHKPTVAQGSKAADKHAFPAAQADKASGNDFLSALLSQISDENSAKSTLADMANQEGAQNGAALMAQLIALDPTLAQSLLGTGAATNDTAAQMLSAITGSDAGIDGISQAPITPNFLAGIPIANLQTPIAPQMTQMQQTDSIASAAQQMAMQKATQTAIPTAQTPAQFESLLAQLAANPTGSAAAKAPVVNTASVQMLAGESTVDTKAQLESTVDTNMQPKAAQSVMPTVAAETQEQQAKTPQGMANALNAQIAAKPQDEQAVANGKIAFEAAAAKLRSASPHTQEEQETQAVPSVKAQDAATEKPAEKSAKPDESTVNSLQKPMYEQRAIEAPSPVKQAEVADKADVMRQITSGAMENAKAGKQDFVMKLTPEGMGEITVKLAEASGKITMQITASNANVQKMLSAEIEHLREAMRPYHVEVREIMSQQSNHFDLGSGNPNANSQQFTNQFTFGQNQNSQRHTQSTWYGMPQTDESVQDAQEAQMQAKPLSAMDMYI